MKTFRQLVQSISQFQSIFNTIYDNTSIETFGTPSENHQNIVPVSADLGFQETRDFTKQSVGESTLRPPQAVFPCESHRSTINQTFVPQPISCQPIPSGLIYKPNRESLGPYLDSRTPPTTPQKSVTLWHLITCNSKATSYPDPLMVLIEGQARKVQFLG